MSATPPSDSWFEDQVVVVSGGANGIGAATAFGFAERGASVAVIDIDRVAADQVVARCGGAAAAFECDVTDSAAVAACTERVLDAYGRVDVLVNNVGHWLDVRPFHLGDPEHWRRIMDVNFTHVLTVTHAFLPVMVERRSGVVISVSSVEGVRAYPSDPVYAAAKAAVNHFTTSMALAYGRRGVRFLAVAPDITNTAQVPYDDAAIDDERWRWWAPLGRPGTPEDQAAAIVALASDQFRFVTGAVINTDGGTGIGGGWWWDDTKRRFVNRPDGLARRSADDDPTLPPTSATGPTTTQSR